MKLLNYLKKIFRSKKKKCERCNNFESLNDEISTISYGFCKTYQIAIFKNSTENCFEIKKNIKISQDPYAPRGKNTPYPNDEFGRAHMDQWLDEVLWKHHG